MHILMLSDQHAASAGGVQVSIRLQTRFLERAGHTVTVCAPRMHAAHAPSRTAAREQSRDRSRGQSGLFMRMRKTPSKAL